VTADRTPGPWHQSVDAQLAALAEIVATHTGQIASLGARLDALEPGGKTGTIYGAATGNEPAWSALDALVGPMPVRRTFESGFVADFRSSKAWPDVAAGRHSVWSFKIGGDYLGFIAGSWDNRIHTLLDTIPDGHRVSLVCQHEPENDAGIVAADWRGTQARLAVLASMHAAPDVLDVVPVLMGWTFNPQSGRDPDDWFDGSMAANGIRTVGIDEYQPADSTWQAWPVRAARFTPVVEGWGCKPAICEVGCPDKGDGTKVTWLRDLEAWATAHSVPFCTWFNYVSGIMSSDVSYLLDSSPEVTAEYRRLVAT
jgi:hypothetical protein